MDLLQNCAAAFERLLPYEYRFSVERKGKMRIFTLAFDRADFHHLAGLHKLKDNVRFLTGKREAIFKEMLEGRAYLQSGCSEYILGGNETAP